MKAGLQRFALAAAALLAACHVGAPEAANQTKSNVVVSANEALSHAGDGRPAAVPANMIAESRSDRPPISETPSADTSAQAAASVIRTYFGLIQAGRFDEAGALRPDLGDREFADETRRYGRVDRIDVGAPGPIEGAAGSLYVEIPLRLHGRGVADMTYMTRGTAVLRRVNDVPGSTAEQRRWHIVRVEIDPTR